MAEVAGQIKLLLDQKGRTRSPWAASAARPSWPRARGRRSSKALTEDLKKIGISVKRKAELEVNGDYRDVEDTKTKLMAVEIKAHVVDRTGAEVVAFEPRGILNVTTIAALIGLTTSLPPTAPTRSATRSSPNDSTTRRST